jgi:serine/threonine protein kinase
MPASDVAAELFAADQAKLVERTIGPYKIIELLGTGGMGEIYLAHDARLGRQVALKLLPSHFTSDAERLRRFEQEARAASALNHPSIVTIHEFGQIDGAHFIVNEFIDGQTLRQHMTETQMKLGEALDVAIQVAGALAAAHSANIVHRDIKPENIMIRHDGYVKVLDFGLAKLTEGQTPSRDTEAATRVLVTTNPGMVMGTVTYMSPEQARGLPVDERTDVWSLGVVLYEMLAGRAPFDGETASHVIVSILEKEPPLLNRCAEVPTELERIVNKALRKNRKERYQTVKDLALDLKSLKEELEVNARLERSVRSDAGDIQSGAKSGGKAIVETYYDSEGRARAARPITRLMVLPFRMLRADPDVDFLSFSVPDAVAGGLSVLDSMVVRSPTGAALYADGILDLKRISEEAQAEAVLTGTILRAGNGIRVTCQLLEAPSGTVLWWHEPQVNMSDLFELQDTLVRRIVESLSLSLSEREHSRLKRDVPITAMAYEFYLRGNELSRRGLAGFGDLTVARDFYLRCVESDAYYAPAWAQLGRCYRLIGKGMESGRENLLLAEAAFRRALELNPDLPLAHSQYAFLEAELGRAKDAVARLLRRAQSGSASPDLFVALVLCLRFCGLLEASVAAHECAHKLDPQIATSVSHTYYQLGDYDSALRHVAVGSWGIVGMTLGTMGQTADGLAALRNLEQSHMPVPMQAFIGAWRAMLEGNHQESIDAAERCIQHYLDPEGVFYMGLIMAHLGESERALTVLSESMDQGFSSVDVLRRNPWFDGLRSTTKFKELIKRGEASFVEAVEMFRSAGGAQVLGGNPGVVTT